MQWSLMAGLVCGSACGVLAARWRLGQPHERDRNFDGVEYAAATVGALGGYLLARRREQGCRARDVMEVLSTDKDLTIFNECIKDLAAGCEGAHGYGTDAIMAMLILTRADAQQSCTVLAPTDQALCGEEFETIMKIYRPRRRIGQKPDPARQSMWLGFMLNHIVGDYCSREDLSQASHVSALSGDQIQVSLLRALAAKSRESAQDASSAGVEGPASGKGTYGKTDYDTLRAWEQGQQIQAPWAFEEVRASNGIIYKIDRILTPGMFYVLVSSLCL